MKRPDSDIKIHKVTNVDRVGKVFSTVFCDVLREYVEVDLPNDSSEWSVPLHARSLLSPFQTCCNLM